MLGAITASAGLQLNTPVNRDARASIALRLGLAARARYWER